MKKTNYHRPRRQPRDFELSEDACPRCGTLMRAAKRSLELPVHGEEITVPNVEHLACPTCHERVFTLEQSRDFHERALLLYRKKYGLLTSDEIRAIRDRLGISQRALALLLRLGPASVARWEANRNVQTASMDVLLRLLRDVPGALTYLRKEAA